jgi:hypothetical protein
MPQKRWSAVADTLPPGGNIVGFAQLKAEIRSEIDKRQKVLALLDGRSPVAKNDDEHSRPQAYQCGSKSTLGEG